MVTWYVSANQTRTDGKKIVRRMFVTAKTMSDAETLAKGFADGYFQCTTDSIKVEGEFEPNTVISLDSFSA